MSALNLAVTDWSGSQRADLMEVPRDTTVGELLAEVKEALHLPPRTPYELIHNGRNLGRGLTLEEVGIEDGEEVTVAPEVSAG
jgi:hypothetical protein